MKWEMEERRGRKGGKERGREVEGRGQGGRRAGVEVPAPFHLSQTELLSLVPLPTGFFRGQKCPVLQPLAGKLCSPLSSSHLEHRSLRPRKTFYPGLGGKARRSREAKLIILPLKTLGLCLRGGKA